MTAEYGEKDASMSARSTGMMKNSTYRRMGRLVPPIAILRDGREICRKTPEGKIEYRRRTMEMAKRQNFLCGLCEMPLGGDITFDHESGRGQGGSNRDDRIIVNGKRKNAAVHAKCNVAKGSRRIPYMIQ